MFFEKLNRFSDTKQHQKALIHNRLTHNYEFIKNKITNSTSS